MGLSQKLIIDEPCGFWHLSLPTGVVTYFGILTQRERDGAIKYFIYFQNARRFTDIQHLLQKAPEKIYEYYLDSFTIYTGSIFFVLQSRILTRRQSFFPRLFLFLEVCQHLCQLSVCCKSVTEKKQCSTPCSCLAYNKHILFLSLNINWFFAGQYKMFVIKYYFILLQRIKNDTQN